MKVKVGDQKAAQYVILEKKNNCHECAFYSKSLLFCISMNCDIDGIFYQTRTLEDIFKL